VLLHGFPTSSNMFLNLMARLATSYHVVAPDYPGFGQSSMPIRVTLRSKHTGKKSPAELRNSSGGTNCVDPFYQCDRASFQTVSAT